MAYARTVRAFQCQTSQANLQLCCLQKFSLHPRFNPHTLSLSLSFPFAPHAPHTIILYNRFVSNTLQTFARQHSYTNTNTSTRESSAACCLTLFNVIAQRSMRYTSRHDASHSIESESVRHMCPLPLWSVHGIFQSLPVRLHQSPPQASCSPSLCNLAQLLENNCPGWLLDCAGRFLRIS